MVSETMDELEEGFVVMNPMTRHRIKVKRATYLVVHRLAGNGTPSVDDVVELYLQNEQAEILSYFPELENHFNSINSVIESLYKEGESLYNSNKELDSQKDFALAIKDSALSGVCFTARSKKLSFHEAFYTIRPTALAKIVKELL